MSVFASEPVVQVSGHRCAACRLVLREEAREGRSVFVSVPEGLVACAGAWGRGSGSAVEGLDHEPEPVILLPFEFRYTTFAEDSEIAFPQEWDGVPVTEAARVQPLIEEILGYCAPLSPRLFSVERVALAGTSLVDYSPMYPEAAECWRIFTGGTVYATHSDPGTNGGMESWPGSAEQVVDSGSWENGAEHGWGVGFGGLLAVFAAAGQAWVPPGAGAPVGA